MIRKDFNFHSLDLRILRPSCMTLATMEKPIMLVLLLGVMTSLSWAEPMAVKGAIRPLVKEAECLGCHSKTSSITKKKGHRDLSSKHFPKSGTCSSCHLPGQVTKLRLLTGEPISYPQSPILCGQCHGLVKRDWDHGIHGKKMGSWTKSGEPLLCVQCHDPHTPKFPLMKALPAPRQPQLGIKKEESYGQH